MAINTEHYKELLLAKEQELTVEMARMGDEARNSRTADVEDSIDQVISAEAKAVGFQVTSIEAETLAEVRAALKRIADGTYGVSVESGDPIPPARLEAVPWTQFTVEEQEKLDKEKVDGDNQDNPLGSLA